MSERYVRLRVQAYTCDGKAETLVGQTQIGMTDLAALSDSKHPLWQHSFKLCAESLTEEAVRKGIKADA